MSSIYGDFCPTSGIIFSSNHHHLKLTHVHGGHRHGHHGNHRKSWKFSSGGYKSEEETTRTSDGVSGKNILYIVYILNDHVSMTKVCARWCWKLSCRCKNYNVWPVRLKFGESATTTRIEYSVWYSGDETWVSHYVPESKQLLNQWNIIATVPQRSSMCSNRLAESWRPFFGTLREWCSSIIRTRVFL